ncbi:MULTISPECIES: hypothetical protein [unclassified Streptomyces]|uniref:hypothetical protein n=1 Tax=unclassified Streptomyces TaxID=2593676 RepID=UPI00081E8100|nr:MULTISPECIES: hypothetical protein [unclassified Streptomyces]MYZ35859.1 hypothetical protein [Streptomyces sp. SID4917]SCF78881.1 hypothetical protein GA0115259_1025514 [Streptomyces sp. MnatMP-M17]
MALLKRRKGSSEERGTRPRVVLAAAVPVTGPDARDAWAARQGDTAWQREAWYHYDACGELRSAVTWIANAVSRAELYAAEVDPATGMPTGPTDNAQAQAAVTRALGGAAIRAQLQYTMAVNWQIPGEVFVLVRPGTGTRRGATAPDEWVALSGTEVEYSGARWSYKDPMTGVKKDLAAGDLLMRVWSPHPRIQYHADSAVRPALPVLREIEKASQNIAARLDSRLASNGLLFVAEEIDFPEQESGATGAEGFMEYLSDVMARSLKNPGTAAAQVPITASLPGELIDKIKHLDISTVFDAAVVALRADGIKRLAESLDMPNEVATGSTGGMNHWGSWKVEEDTYKIYIEPLLDRLGDALTTHWYRPTLRRMGVTNPDRYQLAWNTAEIVQRPNRTEDLKWLHDHDLISDAAMRAEVGVPDDDIPDEEQVRLRRLERVVTAAPTLAADPQISSLLFGFEIAPAAAGVAGQIEGGHLQPEAPSAPERGPRALPATQNDEPPALAASAALPEHLIAATELLVFDALSRAGGRLLKAPLRGQFGSVAKHELYLKIPYDPNAEGVVERLLEGSFQFTGHVAEAFGRDREQLSAQVEEYVTTLIMTRTAHDRAVLRRFL